jgi:hypothetical protein
VIEGVVMSEKAARSALVGGWRVGLLALGALTLWAGRVQAQGLAVEVRGGMVASTALVEDAVVTPELENELGLGGRVEGVRVGPGVAPLVEVAARTGVGRDLALEVAAGWAPAELGGSEAGRRWRAGEVDVGHAVFRLRREVLGRYHVRGGLGVIRYSGGRDGLLRAGPVMRPVLEVGGGAEWQVGQPRLSVGVLAQAHRFGGGAVEEAGGRAGVVWRAGVQVGVAFGRGVR